MPTARMDGTPTEQLLWRVSALREALGEIAAMDGVARQIARNALGVDDYNAETMRKSERYMPQTADEAAERMDNGRNTGGGKMRR